MKKIFTTLVAGLMISVQMMAIATKDVCGQFNGMLLIDWDEYPSRSVYLLPGATDNTLTFVLPDFTFGKGKLGNIVLPNIAMDATGKLTLDSTSLYLDTISLRASIKMLNNFEDEGDIYNSVVSADSAEVTLEIAAPTLPAPIIVYFKGDAIRNNNYALTNGGFEGDWNNNEPAGWHSFGTASGLLNDFVLTDTQKFIQSSEIRPGSKGQHSALISSNMQLGGVKANGNCTNGRVNAGSTVATDSLGNYNYSDPDSTDFNTPFHGRPDSIVFWAKYQPADRNFANDSNKARINAVITTNARYQDPESTPEHANAKIGSATLNYSAVEGLGWQRLSVPFEYEAAKANAQPAYILTTFSTNYTPGGGTSRTSGKGSAKVTLLDSIYLDDVEIIYNKELSAFSIDNAAQTFDKHIATVESNYCDDCAKFAAEGNGITSQTFIGFDAAHKCIFIYVIADDYAQSGSYNLYRVDFADSNTEGINPIDTPDGIKTIFGRSTKCEKMIINGQVLIRRGDAWYSVLGNRVK